ncbi:MAG: hypothetical protein M1823_000468 [Watsoniomyces obsoletus]|nr:MAG: hypothetical protein M1823_000468 [Watsoniomyces obsoletus]
MPARDVSDGSRDQSDGLHNLLAGLTTQSPGPPASSSSNATSNLSPSSGPSLEHLFNTPNRSIFSSGPPTASLSANVAQASLSGAVSTHSSRPLSALTATSASTARHRVASAVLSDPTSSSRSPAGAVYQAEKEVDDPTTPMELSPVYQNSYMATPMALTRLFAPTNSAHSSRQPSYTHGTEHNRGSTENTSLPQHLYHRGFRDGRHSDITVHVFSTSYALHRILLDRAPYFATALSEPWMESTAKDITLHPEELDSNITQAAFELALKRLYGVAIPAEERQEAVGLLATGCWLEMTELVESSVDSLLQQLAPANLSGVIGLVTNNYYGRAGHRLLKAAKAMLFREGWRMDPKHWDQMSGHMIRMVVGSDAFYVSNEWERWKLAWRLFNRRLMKKAMESDVYDMMALPSIRLVGSENLNPDSMGEGLSSAEKREALKTLYAHPDIVAMQRLLEGGIHYMHLSFEQLQFIQDQKDKFGKPAVRGRIVREALWKATELRQKVVNASELGLELGLKKVVPEASASPGDEGGSKGGKERLVSVEVEQSEEDTGGEGDDDDVEDEDTNMVPRRKTTKMFEIPTTDMTQVLGERPDPRPRPAGNSPATPSAVGNEVETDPFLIHLHKRTRSAGKTPAKANNITSSPAIRENTPPQFYSEFPPFRFAVEFPSPRTMKEKKRVYSRTVWYAGSIWNVYVQKMQATKNMQLGVYLHRVRDREGEDMISGAAMGPPRSVDEAIGQLEREMLLRQHERRHRQRQVEAQLLAREEQGGSSGDNIMSPSRGGGVSGLSNLLAPRSKGASNQSARPTYAGRSDARLRPSGATGTAAELMDTNSEDELEILLLDEETEIKMSRLSTCVPALPPYVDGRPTIRTYFKIFQMTPDARSVSVHKSAPDVFNFSQSWGWKTILDDSLLGSSDPFSLGGGGAVAGGNEATPSSSTKDDQLRFCIVLGNI